MSKYLPNNIPDVAIKDLVNLLIPKVRSDSTIELKIKIENKNLNIRELGIFFTFIDKLYGHLQPEGIYSYAHHRGKQVKISSIEYGSLEVSIIDTLLKIEPQQLVIIWLVLKYLPASIKNITSAYKDIEEIKLLRLNRAQIKERMKNEEIFRKLDNKRINQLISIIDYFAEKENRKIPSVIRFIKYFVIDITINLKDKNKL